MLFVALASLLAVTTPQVSAHGLMNWPIIRTLPRDQQNGYTFARAAANRNTIVHPDPDANCEYLPKGPVFTQVLAPGPATVDYTITAHHNGGCIIFLSRDNQKTWERIGEDTGCGIPAKNPTGRGSVNVTIPDGTYNAVLRWTYTANNGGSPNEIFTNCADVSVAPVVGNNKHVKVEFFGTTPAPGFVALPAKNFKGCQTPGATLCHAENNAFIHQCISLAAGGGWSGGISSYLYQCPFGTVCKKVDGIDSCVGPNSQVPPKSPTPTTTTSTKLTPSETKKTKKTKTKKPKKTSTKKATKTTNPAPPQSPKPPTATGIASGPACPVVSDNSLRLPVPVGKTCADIKHACQTFCFEHKWYTVQRNQCYSEDSKTNTAIQWCQCNNVIYYNVAFGVPTTACPK
ncbi:hypothetical protein BDR26DRAFT_1011316 [Obelidium mucronatum]|nr:hypothetical protein BDR26DRAFT_1011316 [Obelidium mucronatum]